MLSFKFLAVALLAATPSLCTPIAKSVIERALPSDCDATYVAASGDTCQSIGAKFNDFTLSQFYIWNPSILQTCEGLDAGVAYCINTASYTFVPPVQAAQGTVESANLTPVPIMPGIIDSCTSYEYAGAGMLNNR